LGFIFFTAAFVLGPVPYIRTFSNQLRVPELFFDFLHLKKKRAAETEIIVDRVLANRLD